MIDLHNQSAYQRIYNRFSTEFIDSYCAYKKSGHDTKDSLIGARNKMQLLLEKQLKANRLHTQLVVKAYRNVSNDSELIEKAIEIYSRMNKIDRGYNN